MSALFLGLLGGVLTLGLSLALPFAVRPLLTRLRIMDVPNERSSHERPVLRGLGLAVLIAMACGGSLGTALTLVTAPTEPGWGFLLAVGAGSLSAGLLGLSEDLNGLSVRVRSAILLSIAIVSSVSLFWIARVGEFEFVAGSFLRNWTLQTPVLSFWSLIPLAVYGVLFISSYINVANFMDGLNGISGFHGVVAGVAFATSGLLLDEGWLVTAGAVLAGGFAGFLPWNLTRPGAFLGDVGSYLLGGATAIISFAAFVGGIPLLATIGPMVIYFGDVGVTLVRRMRKGKRWDEPHKEHVYQRIQQMGYSHVQASAMTAGCTLLASVLGIASIYTTFFGTLLLLAGGLAVLVLYLLLPRLLPSRV
ncbi:UDP-phosphate alpha-N-acetyl-D-fucosaminephosphotransferase [Leucobacter sp. wl10]|uniref:UDP-phosphate alpha-N-acetyl-D-fucosaminephosphotransferase n=1 Tax=Leucobacter sp. wl10 TaxID=2304677 RepID=UPI000E5A71CD|nr:UDP-phosphate alpha-N-acetyl-D-fucosaminephosphotransferase [Leucobacter sp. wl10]RGE24225.1 UDP-phosphate alpha-N-acetyl-D-fucosaminephosphotransferase [Leucobacter sp. wl10]